MRKFKSTIYNNDTNTTRTDIFFAEDMDMAILLTQLECRANEEFEDCNEII